MFSKNSHLNLVFSLLFLLLSACGGVGAGCGCTAQPLPEGGLPDDQTVEGGGQIRVTDRGFQKITDLIPPLLESQLGNGFCIGKTSILTADVCGDNQGDCQPGCNVSVEVEQTEINVKDDQTLHVFVRANIAADVPVHQGLPWPLPDINCGLDITANNLSAHVDVGFGIDAATGEMTLELKDIYDTNLSGTNFSGCSVVSFVANLATRLLDSFLGNFILDLLRPTVNGLIQGFLPDPLGIEGMVDIGQLIGGISPGTEGYIEARMVPGGYVSLQNDGMSLGLITGLNADQDPTTRTAELDSEPAYCVPPIPAPDFGAEPANLPTSTRGTFRLLPAAEFLGQPDPENDLVIGLSETTLDLAGHHLVTSGGMCLGVGTSLVDQLTLGTIGLLVPSLGELGNGTEPLLLVTRPQRALDFTIGQGTDASPALTIHIQDLEVDFYGFIFERYTRAFTMSLDLDVGVNLEFTQSPGMPARVQPILVGLSSDNIGITVLNNEFVRESREQLEAVLPTVFDLALPLLADGLGPIDVPSFAGLTLNNLRVEKIVTSEDEFMAIYASLSASETMRAVARQVPGLTPVLDRIDREAGSTAWPARVTGATATLRSVDVPSLDEVRSALAHRGGALPTVTIDVATHDAAGRPLEWSWNLDNGVWRSYTTASPLVITDRAFAWQSKYQIGLRARVRGDYRTTMTDALEIPVVIDSSGPRILVDQVEVTAEGVTVPAIDVVHDRGLEWAFGRVGEDQPSTPWQSSPTLPAALVPGLNVEGEVLVFVRDPSGNVSIAIARNDFHGAPSEQGCSCAAGGRPDAGSFALVGIVGLFLLGRRRFRQRGTAIAVAAARWQRPIAMLAVWAGLSVTLSLVPGCSCDSAAGNACELSEDCDAIECPEGQIPICFEGECRCQPDVPYGRLGLMSDIAVAPNHDAVVSAYAQTHGDLVVARFAGSGRIPDSAWEFVDGVPSGPVAIPESQIRGGILDSGPDVGLYTSVAIGAADIPMVAYHDRSTGSLKFAAKSGGVWQNHVIDSGTGEVTPESAGEQAGLYNAISLRSDDGRPAIAYLAMISQGDGILVGELRFAEATTPSPTSSTDWMISIVDMMALPAADPEAPDPYPLPGGIGLFIDLARDRAGNPAMAYYDRENGNLKLARWNPANNRFDLSVAAGVDGDDGWYPSLGFDAENAPCLAFQGADHDDVFFLNAETTARELVDDGYRIVGTTPEGLPKPEFHFVGSNTQLVMTTSGPYVIYQDSTSHELLVANKPGEDWTWDPLAGNDATFVGAYGFYASAVGTDSEIAVSTWALNQQIDDNWVEVFRLPLSIGRTTR